jgi:YhcH/YjgK/YiaL family protein
MIIDTVDSIPLYKGFSTNLAAGLEFLLEALTVEPPLGRHPIRGDRVYAVVSKYETAEPSSKSFEAHRRYIDIQFLLHGTEALLWAPLSSLVPQGEYSSDGDCIDLGGESGAEAVLRGSVFAILFPGDAHKPGCIVHGAEPVTKLVIKVEK